VVGGIHLKLYYTRNEYYYVVRHLRGSDNLPLIPEEKSANPVKFESLVTEYAENSITYDNVVYVPSELHHVTVAIRHDDPDNPQLNVITFYYEEQTAQLNYVIVGPAGCGSLTVESERVPIYSGEAAGSTATANDGFKFVGWFYDADCTQQANTNNKLIPEKKDSKYVEQTFYAKFEETYASLTIQNSGANALDENQSFLYRITNDSDFDLTVVIVGNGFATIQNLPAGTYTVTPLSDWSWRYETEKQNVSVTVQGGQQGTLVFDQQRKEIYWLDGNNIRENIYH